MTKKLALVTGGNKGIGYEIVRGLCQRFEGHVLLGSRNNERGQAAVAKLNEEGLQPELITIDISSKDSIDKAKTYIQSTFGGLDILINNAAIAYKAKSTAPFAEQAEVTLGTNYFGTYNICEAMFPLLRPGARVVNVSSMASRLERVSEKLQREFARQDLTKEELSRFMTDFVEKAKTGTHRDAGYSNMAYAMSKLGVTALTRIQGREMDNDPRDDILVNCVCPGYVDTDMTSHQGHLTPEQGADTPLFLAFIPAGHKQPQGEFLTKRKVVEWDSCVKVL